MINAVIVAAIGAWITAIGYRLIGPLSGPNPSFDPRHQKAEKIYRVCGPGMLVGGIGMGIAQIMIASSK